MSESARWEYCRASNPFDQTWVTSPYDRRDLPDASQLHGAALEQLRKVIDKHTTTGLATPILPLVGNTGFGKTYLLRQLVRRSHSAQKRLMVSVPPEEVLAVEGTADALAELILVAIEDLLFSDDAPWFDDTRPIDVLAASVLGELSTKPDGLRVPAFFGMLGKRPAPPALAKFAVLPSQPKRVAATTPQVLSGAGAFAACRALAEEARSLQPHGDLQGDLLLVAAGLRDRSALFSREGTATQLILEFSRVCADRGLPLVILFDQFEDLAIQAGISSTQDGLRKFMLRLNNLVADLVGSDSPTSKLPLFLLSTNQELDPTSNLEGHFKGRFSRLIGDKRSIDLMSPTVGMQVLDFATALELVRAYMSRFWSRFPDPPPDALWPLERPALRHLHAEKTGNIDMPGAEKHTVYSPRDWIMACAAEWQRVTAPPAQRRAAPAPATPALPAPDPLSAPGRLSSPRVSSVPSGPAAPAHPKAKLSEAPSIAPPPGPKAPAEPAGAGSEPVSAIRQQGQLFSPSPQREGGEAESRTEPSVDGSRDVQRLLGDAAFVEAARVELFDGSEGLRARSIERFIGLCQELGLVGEGPEVVGEGDIWFRVGRMGVLLTLFCKGNQRGAHTREFERLRALCGQLKSRFQPNGVRCAIWLRTSHHQFPDDACGRIGRITRVLPHHLQTDDAVAIYGALTLAGQWGDRFRNEHLPQDPASYTVDIKDLVQRWPIWQRMEDLIQ